MNTTVARQRRRWLPAEPVLALADRYGLSHQSLGQRLGALRGQRPGSGERAVCRAAARGEVTIAMADDLAVALDLHPGQVWGWETWLDVPAWGER